jgi:hypothetical protein
MPRFLVLPVVAVLGSLLLMFGSRADDAKQVPASRGGTSARAEQGAHAPRSPARDRITVAESATSTATGVVFHDTNGNRKRDRGEPGLGGIRVSNGTDITRTDDAGRWELPVGDDTILFVVKPRGWRTPFNETRNPEFYYVHKPHGSPPEYKFAGVAPTGPLPASVDFPLYEQEEPETFQAILFGDPQPRNQQEVDWIAHDVVEELVGTDAAFGVTLGDVVFDDLDMFQPQARAIALIGIPWYNVVGNHDVNYDAPSDKLSDETFERHYGPNYYSFDYGPVHFVVLDDIEWYHPDGPEKRGRYRGGLGPEQIEFVANDLAMIPEDQLVVLMMHIPLTGVNDRHPLYRLIEKRPACISISGHTHTHEHVFIDSKDGWNGPVPHHHIVNVTVCGSWWSGAPDERGIPHTTMRDGGPNGYSILTLAGTKYTLDYRAAGRSADYQMQIHAPDAVSSADSASTDLYVNVFNGSERDPVEFRIGEGTWSKLEPRRTLDPWYKATFDAEAAIQPLPWRKLHEPSPSAHLWHAKLPANLPVGVHAIEVRTTDLFGRTFEDRRALRVTQ